MTPEYQWVKIKTGRKIKGVQKVEPHAQDELDVAVSHVFNNMAVNVLIERQVRESKDRIHYMFGDFLIGIKLNGSGIPVVFYDIKDD